MEEAAAAKEVARVTLRVEVFYELLGDFSGCEAVADALELALGSVDVVDVGELDDRLEARVASRFGCGRGVRRLSTRHALPEHFKFIRDCVAS